MIVISGQDLNKIYDTKIQNRNKAHWMETFIENLWNFLGMVMAMEIEIRVAFPPEDYSLLEQRNNLGKI